MSSSGISGPAGDLPAGPFAVFEDNEQAPHVARQSARVLVGGIGLPWLRDLDFGTQFVRRVEDQEWPPDVIVEDLSYAAHRVLHRLQELRPEKVVLVGAMPR